MKIYRGRAFTSKEQVEGCDVIGNPASVVVCEGKFPSDDEMSKIAVEEAQPICVFVKRGSEDSEFDIKFYNPDGTLVCICGHGLVITSYILNRLYSIDAVTFNFDYKLSQKPLDYKTIQTKIIDNIASIHLPYFALEKVKNITANIKLLLDEMGIDKNDLKEIYECEELRDFIFEIKDSARLRGLNPHFKAMIKPCKELNLRCVFVTSASGLKNFDFETRAFIPHSGIDEDIVCGSSSCAVVGIWKKKLSKNYLKCLFPYHYKNGEVGGIQHIKFNDNNSFCLSGNASY